MAPPAGAYTGILTSELRAPPEAITGDPNDEAYLEDSRRRPLLEYSVCSRFLWDWLGLYKRIPNASNVGLSEFRAACDYEARIAPIPPCSFLGAVKQAIDTEIARREACGHTIRVATPWPILESSATALCDFKKIAANRPSHNAWLMPVMFLQKAAEPISERFSSKADLASKFRPCCEADFIALAWQHNSRRLKDLSDDEFADFRAAMESLERAFGSDCKRPDSFAARIRTAIDAELSRRRFCANVNMMVAIMLARERRRAAPEHLTPAAGLAQELAQGLAQGLAELPPRPLEMIADALQKL